MDKIVLFSEQLGMLLLNKPNKPLMLNKLIPNLLAILVCLLTFTTALAQDKKISGKVADESGAGLPGVSVQIKGTKVATSTNVDGNFEINAPAASEILMFSYLGMEAQD